jgi:ribosomal protein L11 methyltransferase
LYRIFITLSKKDFFKKKVENYFENISYENQEKKWKIEIFSKNIYQDKNFLEFVLKIKILKIEKIKNENWLSFFKKRILDIKTERFLITQKKKNDLRNNIFIPASTAFGTGAHPSTYLLIKNIEMIIKRTKKSSLKFLDVGTGTGILSFITFKMCKTKITAIDIDKESHKCFKRNAKLNLINNYNFYCCNGFNSIYLVKKKYNLIISNILLRSLKGLAKGFRDHLVEGGILIISGIDKLQKNEIVNFYSKFNLKLLKSIYIENWVSLIFKKNAKY